MQQKSVKTSMNSRPDVTPDVLGRDFFDRPTLIVAQELLGKVLVRRIRNRTRRFVITEVEAYDGPQDRASHAHRGMTARNASMFGPAGYWYVYLCYGMHRMLNIVTGPHGYPAAVLIRGVEGITGPGRLTKQLCITEALNACLADTDTGLWIEYAETGGMVRQRVRRGPRIGVEYAGAWAKKLYRFWIDA
jgi:DNA-3-methyladenine glycosylase